MFQRVSENLDLLVVLEAQSAWFILWGLLYKIIIIQVQVFPYITICLHYITYSRTNDLSLTLLAMVIALWVASASSCRETLLFLLKQESGCNGSDLIWQTVVRRTTWLNLTIVPLQVCWFQSPQGHWCPGPVLPLHPDKRKENTIHQLHIKAHHIIISQYSIINPKIWMKWDWEDSPSPLPPAPRSPRGLWLSPRCPCSAAGPGRALRLSAWTCPYRPWTSEGVHALLSHQLLHLGLYLPGDRYEHRLMCWINEHTFMSMLVVSSTKELHVSIVVLSD